MVEFQPVPGVMMTSGIKLTDGGKSANGTFLRESLSGSFLVICEDVLLTLGMIRSRCEV